MNGSASVHQSLPPPALRWVGREMGACSLSTVGGEPECEEPDLLFLCLFFRLHGEREGDDEEEVCESLSTTRW